ncbi:hypothetical protein Tco_1200261 [Tanacetum coccineum]
MSRRLILLKIEARVYEFGASPVELRPPRSGRTYCGILGHMELYYVSHSIDDRLGEERVIVSAYRSRTSGNVRRFLICVGRWRSDRVWSAEVVVSDVWRSVRANLV